MLGHFGRWFLNGWRAFFAIAAAISLVSIAARYGFDWRAYFRVIVEWHQEVFAPFQEFVLGPLLRPLFAMTGFRLDAQWFDIATILFLAFGAANAESMARYQRPFVVQLIVAGGAPEWSDSSKETYFGVTPWYFVRGLGLVGFYLIPAGLLAGVFGFQSAAIWGAFCFLYLLFASILQPGAHSDPGLETWSKIVWAPIFITAFVMGLLLSPVLAWRTSFVVCGIFVGFVALNYLIGR